MFPTAHKLPLPPHPLVPSPGRRRRRTLLPTVSAKPRRRHGGRRRNRSWDDDSNSDSDDDYSDIADVAEEEALMDAPEATPPLEEAPAAQPRGSGMLRALERATDAKEAALRSKKARARRREAAEREDEAVGEAKPIEIRSDWGPRMRELELKVRELMEKYHHHH